VRYVMPICSNPATWLYPMFEIAARRPAVRNAGVEILPVVDPSGMAM
jgi:hypothetical protein